MIRGEQIWGNKRKVRGPTSQVVYNAQCKDVKENTHPNPCSLVCYWPTKQAHRGKMFQKEKLLKSLPYQSTNTGNQHLKNDRPHLFARATTVSYLSSTIFSNYTDQVISKIFDYLQHSNKTSHICTASGLDVKEMDYWKKKDFHEVLFLRLPKSFTCLRHPNTPPPPHPHHHTHTHFPNNSATLEASSKLYFLFFIS